MWVAKPIYESLPYVYLLVGALALGASMYINHWYWPTIACDLAPLFGLNKRQVRELAATLGAPEQLVKKVPTADLEELDPQKADEAALNLSYDQIDDFLEGKEVPQDVSDRLVSIYKATQHKRQPIPTIYD